MKFEFGRPITRLGLLTKVIYMYSTSIKRNPLVFCDDWQKWRADYSWIYIDVSSALFYK